MLKSGAARVTAANTPLIGMELRGRAKMTLWVEMSGTVRGNPPVTFLQQIGSVRGTHRPLMRHWRWQMVGCFAGRRFRRGGRRAGRSGIYHHDGRLPRGHDRSLISVARSSA